VFRQCFRVIYRKSGTLVTARSELRKVLFLALSVTFLFVYEIYPEQLYGFAPNSHSIRVWSLAWANLKIKVEGQMSRSPGTNKRYFSALLAACVRFVW